MFLSTLINSPKLEDPGMHVFIEMALNANEAITVASDIDTLDVACSA